MPRIRVPWTHLRASVVVWLSTLLLLTTISPASGQPVSSNLVQQRIQSACRFLEGLYRSDLHLLKVTTVGPPDTAYIASDNLLAAKALTYCGANGISMSGSIIASITTCCGNGDDLMHESLLGTRIPLPIRNATTYLIANSTAGKFWDSVGQGTGAYTVFWEVHNSTGILPDCVYGDVTVYTALEIKRQGNSTGAVHEMDCLNIMWDGTGIVDEAYKNGRPGELGIYQTFKLALYYLAVHNITGSYYTYPGELDPLLRTQGPDGGFHTGYDKNGTYANTQENAETTSITIIALHNLISTTTIFPPFSIPPLIVYTVIGAVVAGGAVAVFLVWLFLLRKKPTVAHSATEGGALTFQQATSG